MLILALAVKGKEFIYKPKTAHQVSKSSAEKIKNALNKINYKIKNDNEIWHIYEIDQYSIAYNWAISQRFTVYKGVLKEKFC